MANRLNMAKIQAIEQLQALKWSQRKIARELGIDRGAVARHLRRLETDPKAAIPPTGSSDPKAATFPPSPGTFSIRADRAGCAASDSDSKAAIPPTGSASMAETNSAVQTPSNAASPEASATVPDWFDPELTPKVQSFCRHYGTVILPTKPYMPRHKGKVESGVKYVQANALKGRKFPNNEAQNRFLADWETGVADTGEKTGQGRKRDRSDIDKIGKAR